MATQLQDNSLVRVNGRQFRTKLTGNNKVTLTLVPSQRRRVKSFILRGLDVDDFVNDPNRPNGPNLIMKADAGDIIGAIFDLIGAYEEYKKAKESAGGGCRPITNSTQVEAPGIKITNTVKVECT